MRFFVPMVVMLIWGCGSDKKSESSSAVTVAEDKMKGIVWGLKSLTVEGVDIPFKGEAFIEINSDNTFVYHEAYLSYPKLDYGPCWYVSKGAATVSDTSFVSQTSEEHGREVCKSNDTSENTDKITTTDNSLSITQTSDGTTIVATYEKSSTKNLDYASLVETVNSKDKIALNASADSYIDDENENDNLTLLSTECDLSQYSARRVTQYYKSEAMGDNRIIEMSYYAPSLDSWVDGKYTKADAADSCDAPGYSTFIAKDLKEVKSRIPGSELYACGSTCTYTLVSETHDTNNVYTSLEFSWECTNVGTNRLFSPSIFGNVIDKHVGKATCSQ